MQHRFRRKHTPPRAWIKGETLNNSGDDSLPLVNIDDLDDADPSLCDLRFPKPEHGEILVEDFDPFVMNLLPRGRNEDERLRIAFDVFQRIGAVLNEVVEYPDTYTESTEHLTAAEVEQSSSFARATGEELDELLRKLPGAKLPLQYSGSESFE